MLGYFNPTSLVCVCVCVWMRDRVGGGGGCQIGGGHAVAMFSRVGTFSGKWVSVCVCGKWLVGWLSVFLCTWVGGWVVGGSSESACEWVRESVCVCGGGGGSSHYPNLTASVSSLCIHDRLLFPLRKVLKLPWISSSCILWNSIAFVSIISQRGAVLGRKREGNLVWSAEIYSQSINEFPINSNKMKIHIKYQ